MRTLRETRSNLDLSNVIAQDSRGASVLVASAILGLVGQRLWASADPLRDQARDLAHRVMLLDAELGAVCDRDLSERVIAAMSESAHSLLQGVRGAADRGCAMLRCREGAILTDERVEQAVVMGYSIVIG